MMHTSPNTAEKLVTPVSQSPRGQQGPSQLCPYPKHPYLAGWSPELQHLHSSCLPLCPGQDLSSRVPLRKSSGCTPQQVAELLPGVHLSRHRWLRTRACHPSCVPALILPLRFYSLLECSQLSYTYTVELCPASPKGFYSIISTPGPHPRCAGLL